MFPEKLPVYFEMPLDGQRVLGEDFKFQFPKFGVFAWSQEEAEEKVRQWQKKFIAEVKAKKNKPKNEEVPFESPTQLADGTRLLKNKPLTK